MFGPNDRQVKVGCYDPFNVLQQIKGDFYERFPLANLHWRSNASSQLKTITSLPVQIVEEVPKSKRAIGLDDVYTRIMFVKFDNLDIYRSQVRPLIKEWLSKIIQPTKSEWLLVLFVPSDKRDKQSTFVKMSPYDKLKVDFGIDGKELQGLGIEPGVTEHCFKLKEKFESQMLKLETYNELMGFIKSSLLSSFTFRHELYNEQIQKLSSLEPESIRMKLNLADLFSKMRLYQESLSIVDSLADDLDDIYNANSEKFSKDLPKGLIPDDLNNYRFIDTISKIQDPEYSDETLYNIFTLRCRIFADHIHILTSLAEQAKSFSLSSIYLSNLFRKLIQLLDLFSAQFGDSLNEWIYVVCAEFLDLPVCKRLEERSIQHNQDNDSTYKLNEILELRSELLLVQRSKLMHIADKKGYKIKGVSQLFDEISLGDQPAPSSSISTSDNLSYNGLVDILNDEATYFRHFEALTEQIIRDFVDIDRIKSIDILSIDLAFLNFQLENYEKSLTILQDSYDYFVKNSWNFMGGVLLEIYLKCVELVESKEHGLLLKTCLNLFSLYLKNKNTIGINNYRLLKNENHIESLYKEILKQSSLLSGPFEYPLECLFDVKIKPSIECDFSTTLDRYYVEVVLNNYFGIPLDFEQISIEIENNNEHLTFSSDKVHFSKDIQHHLKLYSNKFKRNYFMLEKIKVKVNDNLCFVSSPKQQMPKRNLPEMHASTIEEKDLTRNTFLDSAMLNETNDNFQIKGEVLCFYTDSSKFHVELCPPYNIKLNENKVLLVLYNGNNTITNVQVNLSSESYGVQIDKYSIEDKLYYESISSGSKIEIAIPYAYVGEDKVLNMKAEIKYDCNNETFENSVSEFIDTSLPVSVSVQDIFTQDNLFSKFQVGPAVAKAPIRISACTLTDTDGHYKLSSPTRLLKDSMIVHSDQPATFFYKITPSTGHLVSSNDRLDLEISYSCLYDDCYANFKNIILRDLKEKNLTKYFFIIKEAMLKELEYDLNYYSVSGIIRIINSDAVNEKLKNVLDICPNVTEAEKIKNMIQQLISRDVTATDSLPVKERTLYISVPVPTLSILQVIEFQYEKRSQFLVGEPIEMTLKVDSITKWAGKVPEDTEHENNLSVLAESSPSPKKPVKREIGCNGNLFQLVIQNEESWLISGFKKLTFNVDRDSDENVHVFKTQLIPLNVGRLVLPKVFVKTLDQIDKNFSMDVNFKNGSETILVVPELESITFSF
ncbi:Piso0_003089 [Millerozyma farinosa CBS 7064]|uniref:Piso0_003089 protein n=1 Tax=Pichia sorbitophila (strain ATCC MYA-4447 / BCRC 22081 / CBS 7064 / NBRC 10061 / NRRL Y-12695) TaxID=559304 RepID=G8YH58_PICSO|nr:Piso0_003089 [Millerozyma farinosa CBS 7064]CCE80760.1 Piso0_003089 [Millerozyma farinosa CBS 7064]